jgi:hypothetical protein
MFLDKSLYVPRPGSPWHNDLDTSAREYLDREAAGALAFTHRKARRIARLFGI